MIQFLLFKSIVVITVFFFQSFKITPAQNQSNITKPNIIFLVADDLGWMDVAYNGNTYYETPNIDDLSKNGMIFNNAYAASPFCSPTRASIMTGLYPSRIGITSAVCHVEEERFYHTFNEKQKILPGVLLSKSATRLSLEYHTIAEELKMQNYVTAHIGKWHLGRKPYGPENQGFDFVFPDKPEFFRPEGGYLTPESNVIDNPPLGVHHISDLLVEESIKFISSHPNQPFFLNFWNYSVHGPYNADLNLIKYFEEKAKGNEDLNPVMAAMIKHLDNSIGKLIDYLKRNNLFNNTIIIWVSDNGGINRRKSQVSYVSFSKPYGKDKPVTINYPLRGEKGTIYEGGIRVPMIVSWPNLIKSGSYSDAVVSTLDYFPTILNLLNLEKDNLLDGKSILPALLGDDLNEQYYFCHNPTVTLVPGSEFPATVIRMGEWKLIIWYFKNPDFSHQFELFNLKTDISETINLADNYPEIVTKLKSVMDQELLRINALIPKRVN